MIPKKAFLLRSAVLSLCFAGLQSVGAAIHLTINYDESQDRTTISYSGTWETFPGTFTYSFPSESKGIAQEGLVSVAGGEVSVSYPDGQPIGYTGWASIEATSRTGDDFSFSYNIPLQYIALYAPKDYVVGSPIEGALIFDGYDLEEMGLTPEPGNPNAFGSGLISGLGAGNDITWEAKVVPEPGALSLLLLSTAALFRRRVTRGPLG